MSINLTNKNNKNSKPDLAGKAKELIANNKAEETKQPSLAEKLSAQKTEEVKQEIAQTAQSAAPIETSAPAPETTPETNLDASNPTPAEPNYKVVPVVDDARKLAVEKGWKMTFLLGMLGVTDGDMYVVFQDTTQMPENLAKVISVIEQQMPFAILAPSVPAAAPNVTSDKKGKTQGVFEINSVFNPKFALRGSSSQIEICTRDYMSWCLKDKAPKDMQTEYDRAKKENKESDPKKIFTVKILKVADNPDTLKSAKEEFGLSGKGGKPNGATNSKSVSPEDALKGMQPLNSGKAPENKAEEKETVATDGASKSVPQISDSELYDKYKEGVSVDELCQTYDIRKDEFYKKMEQFK